MPRFTGALLAAGVRVSIGWAGAVDGHRVHRAAGLARWISHYNARKPRSTLAERALAGRTLDEADGTETEKLAA